MTAVHKASVSCVPAESCLYFIPILWSDSTNAGEPLSIDREGRISWWDGIKSAASTVRTVREISLALVKSAFRDLLEEETGSLLVPGVMDLA